MLAEKDYTFFLRLSQKEYEYLAKTAKKANVPVSTFVASVVKDFIHNNIRGE